MKTTLIRLIIENSKIVTNDMIDELMNMNDTQLSLIYDSCKIYEIAY